ncbi:hypothetical protein ACIA49_23725 [Kribbella sp. NPDC051587]|uniref:hypothetical protein n=1 Tax=Kribbella sp. NPDC051587 TaxID=3364119 RepID=UPI003789E2B8
MELTAAEVEELFEKLGQAGVNLSILVEPQVPVPVAGSWHVYMSGPGAGAEGFQARGCHSFAECLDKALAALRHGPGDWHWLDLYLDGE